MECDLWTPEREAAAIAWCQAFAGTPHMQRRANPGRGIDCIRFAVGAIQAAGILPDFHWPQYPQTIGLGQATNWMADAILRHTHSHSIAPADWIASTGDLGIFRVGRQSNHIGVVVAGRFWHVTTGRPVHHCSPDTVRGHLQEIIRLDAAGLTSQPAQHQIA